MTIINENHPTQKCWDKLTYCNPTDTTSMILKEKLVLFLCFFK